MPQGLRDLCEIHAAFVKAFSLHRAHNGPAAPAELNELMQSITRLYKKTSVNKEDIQHMLAMYEAEEKTEIPAKASLLCKESPFKLMTSGVGSSRCNFVEYVKGIESGNNLYEFDAKRLHNFYKGALDMVYICGRSNRHSFIHGPVSDYPLLAFAVGSQTAARQQKASELRKHVLNKAPECATSPEFSKLSITQPDSPPQASKAVKSRTLSLFERVKAKQTANAAMAAPTSEAILRKHAIARMDEVVEIMKMKQQQKLNNEIFGAAYCSGPETPLRRVSFTMSELVKIVKASMVNPIGSEELQTCITIVAREVPGFWLRRLDMDGVLCVVLQGNGPVGMDVQRMMKAKESRKLDAEICDAETS
jgi:DNA replication factor Cdt1 C-terminal domain